MVKLALPLVGLLALAGALASCAAAPKTEQPQTSPAVIAATPAGEEPAPDTGVAAPVPKLLDFTAPRLGGGQVVGSELAGKDVAMFFWAPW